MDQEVVGPTIYIPRPWKIGGRNLPAGLGLLDRAPQLLWLRQRGLVCMPPMVKCGYSWSYLAAARRSRQRQIIWRGLDKLGRVPDGEYFRSEAPATPKVRGNNAAPRAMREWAQRGPIDPDYAAINSIDDVEALEALLRGMGKAVPIRG